MGCSIAQGPPVASLGDGQHLAAFPGGAVSGAAELRGLRSGLRQRAQGSARRLGVWGKERRRQQLPSLPGTVGGHHAYPGQCRQWTWALTGVEKQAGCHLDQRRSSRTRSARGGQVGVHCLAVMGQGSCAHLRVSDCPGGPGQNASSDAVGLGGATLLHVQQAPV